MESEGWEWCSGAGMQSRAGIVEGGEGGSKNSTANPALQNYGKINMTFLPHLCGAEENPLSLLMLSGLCTLMALFTFGQLVRQQLASAIAGFDECSTSASEIQHIMELSLLHILHHNATAI